MSPHVFASIEDRIRSRVIVDPRTGCWIWQRALAGHGYGQIRIGQTAHYAHRIAYEHFVGPIPEGMTLDHLCHTNDPECPGGDDCPHRRCCNPEHLEVVTRGENVLRGVGFAAVNARKTHCPSGHEYTLENTALSPEGWRSCRVCSRVNQRRRKAARKAAA